MRLFQGEGGSDVGALIGALTGVVSTLFGVSVMAGNLPEKLLVIRFSF